VRLLTRRAATACLKTAVCKCLVQQSSYIWFQLVVSSEQWFQLVVSSEQWFQLVVSSEQWFQLVVSSEQ
jgi:hypothetical protein